MSFIWDKVFKNGPSKICGRISVVCFNTPYHFKFFKGCLRQFLLGPVLNSLSHITFSSVTQILPILNYFKLFTLSTKNDLEGFSSDEKS